jgi:Tol biopolymer transport system component
MKRAITFFLAIFIQFTAFAQPSNKTVHLVTKEESLGKLLPGAEPNTLTVDANFKHVAYVAKRGTNELAVVDGVEGKEYDNISDHCKMLFSPDGKRFAYVAKRGNKMVVVADGKEGKEYDHIDWSPIFSPDSKRLAYIAAIEDSLKEQQGIWSLKDFIVEDGVEGKPYQLAEAPIFSPDSKKLAYAADLRWNRETCLVVDGIEGRQYAGVSEALFSPDSSRLAYVASKRHPDRDLVVIDGKEGKPYDIVSGVSVDFFVFSPDGKHTAYRVVTPHHFVVRDDSPGKSYDSIGSFPVFSPDSKRLAYVALKGTNRMVVVDDKIFDDQNVFEYTHNPVFSPDSQHLAYMSRIGTNWFAVVDGVVEKRSKNIFSEPVFSPDSKRLIYLKRHGEKSVPVFGELEGKDYGRFLTCNPLLNTMGVWGPRDVAFAFDERKAIHAMVLRGDEILRLEFEIVGE